MYSGVVLTDGKECLWQNGAGVELIDELDRKSLSFVALCLVVTCGEGDI